MKRRKFMKRLFYLSGTLFMSALLDPLSILKKLIASPSSKLVAIKGKDYEKNLQIGIDMLGGIEKFIKKGDKVVIKPNIAWNRAPEMAANTNPEVVAGLVKLCRKAGAKQILVFDRTCNNPYKSYKKSGIKDAAKKAGAKVVYVNKVSDKLYKKVRIPKGRYLKDSLVCKYILEADKIINVPVAKVHSSAGLTIALKNWMGTTGDRRRYWHLDLHNAIADYASIMKPTLTVIDATRVMIKKGPTGGRLEYVRRKDLIIISTDQLLADVYTAKKIFNRTPEDIKYFENAYKLGVGEIDLNKAKIIERIVK